MHVLELILRAKPIVRVADDCRTLVEPLYTKLETYSDYYCYSRRLLVSQTQATVVRSVEGCAVL